MEGAPARCNAMARVSHIVTLLWTIVLLSAATGAKDDQVIAALMEQAGDIQQTIRIACPFFFQLTLFQVARCILLYM